MAAVRLLQQIKSGSVPIGDDNQMDSSEEYLSRLAVLNAIDTICSQETEKRDVKHVPQTFASLLRRRKAELVGAGDTTLREAAQISIILAEDEAGLNKTSSDLASDASVRFAIQKQKIRQPTPTVAEVVAIAKTKVDEDEVERQQSDAVREDFLSGTAVDTKNNTSKSLKKTSKANKKNKACRKVKDPKVNYRVWLYILVYC